VAGNSPGGGSGGGQVGAVTAIPQDSTGTGLPGDSEQQPNSFSAMSGSPPPESMPGIYDEEAARAKQRPSQADLSQSRGKDWALGKKPQRAVPIRRTINVVVRQNQIAILPDGDPTASGTPPGDVVPFQGDTVEAVDEFVKQVHERIESWGIAGNGLYWRPVLLLTVGPQGERRAGDLTRLLKNSGLEVRTSETARNTSEGDKHETR
jgi:hypothetical protein